jgi:putative drug exporter of the RND superfamily
VHRVGAWLARTFVRVRLLVVAMCVAAAVWAGTAFPSIGAAGGGALSELAPKNAPALTAEKISATQFGFPLLSRTTIVVRNPDGLSAQRQASLVQLAARLSHGRLPAFRDIPGALPLLNSVGTSPSSSERGTTALLYLYFPPSASATERTRAAHRLIAREVGRRPGEFVGVTGEAPAQVAQQQVVSDHLQWVELATIALVALAIAVHFRAPLAALITVGAVAVAYVVADHLVAEIGRRSAISVPAEVQPVLVVLVFGVVTDYSVFFLSQFRASLASGADRRSAGVQVMRDVAPIVAVAGVTVACGTAGLLVARLGFLRAFGPGLAVAVVIAMLAALTFVPAMLTVFGRWVFWPRRFSDRDLRDGHLLPDAAVPERRRRALRLVVAHPALAALLALAVILGAASGLSRIALGNELILGLPADSGPHRAYEQASAGFAPGVLAPAVVVVSGQDLPQQLPALERLQGLLSDQPGVAQVVGVRQQPTPYQLGDAISRDGRAARYVLFLGADPLSAQGIADVRALVHRLPALLRRSGLSGTRGFVGGDSALSADTVNATVSDLQRVAPTALVAILCVLALYLRALVAPIYLVATSALGAAAALGLAVYVMKSLLGVDQITYYVVFVVPVLLISLGSDYNVFLIGQVWHEARRRPLREAVEIAGSRATRPIATAAIVLTLSFALLAIVPLRAFREIALTMGLGLLIDAFIVRTVLVPAMIALVDVKSAWPGHRLRSSRAARRPPGRGADSATVGPREAGATSENLSR